MKNLVKSLALASTLLASAAHAAILDFSSFTPGNGATPIYIPGSEGVGATIVSDTGNILIGTGAAGESDGFCFTTNPASSCEFGGSMMFDSAITNLFFDIDGASVQNDFVTINAFLNGVMVGGGTFANGNETVDFSGLGALDMLVFIDDSTAAGVGYSTFTFDGASVPVSTPATMAMLGLALVWLSRKRVMN